VGAYTAVLYLGAATVVFGKSLAARARHATEITGFSAPVEQC
jgi:hypothetical protein